MDDPRGRLLSPSCWVPAHCHPPQPLTLTLMNMSDPKRLKRLVRLCTFFFVLEEVTCLGPAALTICRERKKCVWWEAGMEGEWGTVERKKYTRSGAHHRE